MQVSCSFTLQSTASPATICRFLRRLHRELTDCGSIMTDIASQPSHGTLTGLGADQPVIRPHAGFKVKLLQWILFDHNELILPILRDFAPIIVSKKKKRAFVMRYDDVKEVFLADDDFGVPYGEKLNVITGG